MLATLSASAPVAWIKASSWAYPALESVHLLGVGLVFGTIWLVDTGILGWRRSAAVAHLSGQILPWTWVGFALAAGSGAVLFITQPGDLLANPAFLTKLVLLALAGLNAAALHARGAIDPGNRVTRLQASFSLGVWIAIVVAGRWIGYL